VDYCSAISYSPEKASEDRLLSITVVLVDDHAIIRDGLGTLLDSQPDISVIGDAANGREAVGLASRLHPDVMVMDLTMPEMNGIEATYRILRGSSPPQIIILSMHASIKHVVRAMRAGARGYLPKEAAGAEVAEAVRTVHEGYRYLSPKVSDQMIDIYLSQFAGTELKNPLTHLSSRERETLQLVVEGKSNADIARILDLSLATVDTYRSRLMRKLEISDLPGLVKFAVQQGMTPLD
jgi:DNA-binding NarL/FixJ family response regulator